MAYSTRTIGIIVSSAIAVLLIVGAVLISGPLPFFTGRVSAESTHELLVEYASRDTDADGLPDWQESLYGTDLNNPRSVDPNLLDGQAVAQGLVEPRFANATTSPSDLTDAPGVDVAPQTITDQFAREFFGQYLSQYKGQTPSPEDVATFVEEGLRELGKNQARPDAYNLGQVRVRGAGPEDMRTYAANIERAFAAHSPRSEKSEAEYFDDLMLKNDAAALTQIEKISASYIATAKAYIAVEVPKEAATPHLAVANALARLGGDINDMTYVKTDPMRAYLGLANYENDAPALIQALAALHGVYAAEQVSIPQGTPGAYFYNALERAAAGPPTQTP